MSREGTLENKFPLFPFPHYPGLAPGLLYVEKKSNMDREHELFRVAAALAALFTGCEKEEDRQAIEAWSGEDARHLELLERLVDKQRFEENLALTRQYPGEEAWERVKERVTGGKTRGRTWRRLAAGIAAACLFTGGAWVYLQVAGDGKAGREIAVTGNASPFTSGTTGVLLTLGDGRVVNIGKETVLEVMEQDGTTVVIDSTGAGYLHAGDWQQEMVYNVARTPTGMEFPVTLSDGTLVYLNAESSLRFPVSFTGERREVELSGEAFFKVATDAGRPFTVRAGGVETRVAGTSFNLRAYENERVVTVTLLEGSVALASEEGQWVIVPGEQALYVKMTGRCETRVVDVEHYTAWRSGKFVFRNERLEDILSYLARWYGFEYTFHDEEARDVVVGANLDRYNNMEPIIQMLERSRLVRLTRHENKLEIYLAR